MIDATEALALGLVLDVVTDRPLLDHAVALARGMAQSAPLAQAMAKRLFDAAPAQTLDQFLAQEYCVQPMLATTTDHREGVEAMRGGRPPHFTGADALEQQRQAGDDQDGAVDGGGDP